MAPNVSKANWKTYDAQARLVRALIAAHPEVKWNYKEICACYGSDLTVDAINHRFRRFKAQSVIIKEGRQAGLDIKHMVVDDKLPPTIEKVDTRNIAKYFGATTSAPNTPSKGHAGGTPVKTPGSRKRAVGPALVKREPGLTGTGDDEDGAGDDVGGNDADSWSDKDLQQTPSKRPKTTATPQAYHFGTPARGSARQTAADISFLHLDGGASSGNDDPPPPPSASSSSTSTPHTNSHGATLGHSPSALKNPIPIQFDDIKPKANTPIARRTSQPAAIDDQEDAVTPTATNRRRTHQAYDDLDDEDAMI